MITNSKRLNLVTLFDVAAATLDAQLAEGGKRDIWADVRAIVEAYHAALPPEPEEVRGLIETLESISEHTPEGGDHAATINVAIEALERFRLAKGAL